MRMIDRIKEKFLNVFEPELLLEISKKGVWKNFDKGQVLIKKDQYLKDGGYVTLNYFE